MVRAVMLCTHSLRQCSVPLMVLGLVSLGVIIFLDLRPGAVKPCYFSVDHHYKKMVHAFVRNILSRECRPAFVRTEMESRFNSSGHIANHFLWKDTPLSEFTFKYPPPFGFQDLREKLWNVLSLLPSSVGLERQEKRCQRCVVVGNGGILRGLELGRLIDQFDVVIRLNSGPVKGFSMDAGNRTSIRMSYPEGSPRSWVDHDPKLLFVAVVYKSVDFNWLRAMITREPVSFWDWLFFWQKVPDIIPVEISQFRILNPEIIKETALDLLQLPTPQARLWGWDQNVPTLGMTAVTLASYLCDEVSLAGFGYNLTQKETPLHYYDHLPMTAMLRQDMHNVGRESFLLKRMAGSGVISDLTGGVHCSFC